MRLKLKTIKRIGSLFLALSLVLGLIPFVIAANDDDLFYERPQEKTDYAYSFAVVGDTQTHVETDVLNGTTYTHDLYKWIVDNKEQKNIQWVFGLGDITENLAGEGVNTTEWTLAKDAISQLDMAGIPYSLSRGNHDNTKQFNAYFGPGNDYAETVTGFYDNTSIANHYINFEVSGTKYMVLSLDFGMSDAVVEWANEVVAANPDRRVIITTHMYLEPDGSMTDASTSWAPDSGNHGATLWNKLIYKHRNVIMVLSGHLTYRNVGFSQQTGAYGNMVSQFLVDPQDNNYTEGFVCMLYFSEDGKEASAEWISTTRTQAAQAKDPTAQDILYGESNQFDFTVTKLDNPNDHPSLSSLTVNGEEISLVNGVLDYEVTGVTDAVEKVLVLATSHPTNASVTVKGADEQGYVKLGNPNTTTTIEVAVTYEQVTTTYTVNIYRKSAPWDGTTVATGYAGGTGTAADPYLIASAPQLKYFGDNVVANAGYSGKHFKLIMDIDMNNVGVNAFGDVNNGFQGTFDGDNHTIYNYHCTDNSQTHIGFFSNLKYGTVKNLHLADALVEDLSKPTYIGGIAGKLHGARVENCSFDGVITAGHCNFVGAIGGMLQGSVTLVDCWATGSISATSNGSPGGLVGSHFNGGSTINITSCWSAMTVTGPSGKLTAGIIPGVGTEAGSNTLNITDCYFIGTVNSAYPITGTVNGSATASGTNTVNASNVYYKEGWYAGTGTVTAGGTPGAMKSANEFKDGTVTALLNRGKDTPAWTTWKGQPLRYSGPEFMLSGVLGFSVNKEEYTISSDGTYTFAVEDVSADTSVTVSADKESALTVDNNRYTVTTGGSETVKVTVVGAANGHKVIYTVTVTDSRWDGSAAQGFAGGTGSAADPYLIATASQLKYFGDSITENAYAGKHIKLIADIDMSSVGINTFGDKDHPFQGTFDGDNHTIYNYYCNDNTNSHIGFFSTTYGTTIKNLHFSNARVEDPGTPTYIGGIVGKLYNSRVENCSFDGVITVGHCNFVGAIAGMSQGSVTVADCWTAGSITAGSNGAPGGVLGSHFGGGATVNITSCWSSMTVTGPSGKLTAGIIPDVGTNAASNTLNITDCYFIGTVNSAYPITGTVNGSATASGTNTVNVTNTYCKEGWYAGAGTVTAGGTAGVMKSANEFKDGTVTALLNQGKDTPAWTTWKGQPLRYSGPELTLSGIDGFATDVETYSVFSNGDYIFDVTNVSEGTSVSVSADNMTALTVESNRYTVAVKKSETVVVTVIATKNGLKAAYTITITDPRWDGSAAQGFAGGSGSANDPYLIANAKQLKHFGDTIIENSGYFNKHFKLTADIDMNGIGVNAFGDTSNGFKGTLDGDNHTIYNYYCNDNTGTHIGFFAMIKAGTVKNLHFANALVEDLGKPTNIGGIAGKLNLGARVENCSFDGVITAGHCNFVGAIGGMLQGTVAVVNCSSTGSITVGSNGTPGGIVGAHFGGDSIITITSCWSAMTVTGPSDKLTAGIIPGAGTESASNTLNITNCHFVGTVNSPYPITASVNGSATASGTNTVNVTNTYYKEGWYAGTGIVAAAGTPGVMKSAAEFADGTVATLLGSGWATSTKGYPVITDFVIPTNALVDVGTSIRTVGTQGMRFHFKVDTKAQIAGLKEYGVVVSKAANAQNGLLVGTEKSVKAIAFDGEKALHVREDVPENNTTYDYFSLVINFSTDKNWNTAYNARAYAVYVDSMGQELIVYSDTIDGVNHPNTLYSVAKLALADAEAPDYSDAELAYLHSIVNKIEQSN